MIRYSGSRVPLLELYRHAVDMKAQTPHEVDVIGLMRGRLPVRCDICRGITVWHEKRR